MEHLIRVTTLIPLIFYFFPAPFIGKFYLNFLYETINQFNGDANSDAQRELRELNTRIIRIISFVSFLAIYISVIISFILSTKFWYIHRHNFFICYVLGMFSITGILLIVMNLKSKNKFIVTMGHRIFEGFLVLVSVYLINIIN